MDYSRDDWGFVLLAVLRTTAPSPPVLTLQVSDSYGHTQLQCPSTEHGSHSSLRSAIEPYSDEQKAQVHACLRKHLEVAIPLEQSSPILLENLCDFVRGNVEWAILVDDSKLFVQGWLLDADDCVTSVQVRLGGGSPIDLLEQWSRQQRPDVAEAFPHHAATARGCGFVCLAEFSPRSTDADSAKSSLENAELIVHTARGQMAAHHFTVEQHPRGSTLEQAKRFLERLRVGDSNTFEILDRHIGPTLDAVWTAPEPVATRTLIEDFGRLPESPLCSIIVPLYGRYDFLQYQLAEFSRDPDFFRAEIIYVVDDPNILDAARGLARQLHPLFRLPFRLVFPGKNLGFAGANNFGVTHASAPLLILLNSDVLPARAGWLARLRDLYHHLESPGAIGPRLLFEDGTIQHDGIAFQTRSELSRFVLNDHPGKGLPLWLAPETPVEEVPAITAACLMMDRRVYDELGGLDTGYILGDFEDSHLCLAARNAGYKNYLVRSEALYHLERLSQSLAGDQDTRLGITLYNAWRHTRIWGAELMRLAALEEEL
jgi:GT2 family glycosyltransferase